MNAVLFGSMCLITGTVLQRFDHGDSILVVAIPFGAVMTICLPLAISSTPETYSRYALALRTSAHHRVDYCLRVLVDVIWYISTYTAYSLAYGCWAARYTLWYMRRRSEARRRTLYRHDHHVRL